MFPLKQLHSYQDKRLSTLQELLCLSNKEEGETAMEHLLNEQFSLLPPNYHFVLIIITYKLVI